MSEKLQQLEVQDMEVIPDNDPRVVHNEPHLCQFMAISKYVNGRLVYKFYGRTQSQNSDEELNVEWMQANGLGSNFRNELIDRLGSWIREPVGKSTVKGMPPKITSQPDGSKFYNHGSQRTCAPCSVMSALSYIGAENNEEKIRSKLKELQQQINDEDDVPMDFMKTIDEFKKSRGFRELRRPKAFHRASYDLLSRDKGYFIVAQICAAPEDHFHNIDYHDNAHSIVVTRGNIFDANMKGPLTLSKDNLDKCCVGGTRYRFHHLSRVYEFLPTKKTLEKCSKVIRKRQSVKRKLEPSLKKTVVVKKRVRVCIWSRRTKEFS